MSEPLHLVCPSCSTVNRVLPERLGAGRCGRCKQPLFTGKPIEVDDASFGVQVGSSASYTVKMPALWTACTFDIKR